MEFTKLLNCRRSIRTFTGNPVSDAVRTAILHAANAAPVGLAKYDSVHLTVVRDPALLAELEQATARAFQVTGRSFLYGAPELIVVSTTATDNVGFSNAAIIAHNMALAATDAGIGVCHIWGCIHALSADAALCKKIGIPTGFTPACAVAIGQTEDAYAPRQIPEDRISINYV